MKVILSSNIPHYYYTARALQEAGYLWRYVTSIGIRDSTAAYLKVLPAYWRRKLESRSLEGLKSELVQTIWSAEMIQKGGIRSGLIPVEAANWLNNQLYDRLARRWIDECDIFHFVSGIGLHSARKAKSTGSLVICDERAEYPDYQRRILMEEYDSLGLRYDPPGLSYDAKIKAEYAIADYLILPSEYARSTFVQAGYDESRLLVVPYGVDVQFFATEDMKEGRDDEAVFRIIYAGQIIPRKGVHYLIEAFERLDLPNSELIIAGRVDRKMRTLLTKAVAHDKRIRVVGSVPKAQLRSLYRCSSVFVLPSLADSWGLVCAEAMACKLPVIITVNTGSKEIVRHGEEGYIVPIRDPGAIADHLHFLHHQPQVCHSMGLKAHQRALDFTWEAYSQTLMQAYRRISEESSKL